MALLIAALLRRPLRAREVFAIRVVPVAIVFCTTVYLGFHWVTDSVAGLLLGVVLARLIERIPWDRVPLPRLGGWERPAGLAGGTRAAEPTGLTPRRPPASPA